MASSGITTWNGMGSCSFVTRRPVYLYHRSLRISVCVCVCVWGGGGGGAGGSMVDFTGIVSSNIMLINTGMLTHGLPSVVHFYVEYWYINYFTGWTL